MSTILFPAGVTLLAFILVATGCTLWLDRVASSRFQRNLGGALIKPFGKGAPVRQMRRRSS